MMLKTDNIKMALVLAAGLSLATVLQAGKDIPTSTPTGKALDALTDFIKSSDLLTPDLKKACEEKPARYRTFAVDFMTLVSSATQRPERAQVNDAAAKLAKGTATLQDVVTVHKDTEYYGQAQFDAKNDEFKLAHDEPTTRIKSENENPVRVMLILASNGNGRTIMHRRDLAGNAYRPADEEIRMLIRGIGAQQQWHDAKILHEQATFFKNVAAFINAKE